MREIKLRAWHKTSRCMMRVTNLGFYQECGVTLVSNESTNEEICLPFDAIELMQFTGQKDRNGRKVYEGDILEAEEYWGERDYATVVWNDRELQWYLTRNGRLSQPLRTPFADGEFVFAVVGNIYENPELVPLEAYQRLTGNAMKPLDFYEKECHEPTA